MGGSLVHINMGQTSASFLWAFALLALLSVVNSFEEVERIVPESSLSQAQERINDLQSQFTRLQGLLATSSPVVEPISVVQAEERIGNLQTQFIQAQQRIGYLKTQFIRLQNQMQAGAKITPGVKKTVENMLRLIPDLTKAITEARTAEQSELNEQAKIVVESEGKDVRSSLLESAKTYQDAIGRFNTYAGFLSKRASSHVKAIAKYKSSLSADMFMCCTQEQALFFKSKGSEYENTVAFSSSYAKCDVTQKMTKKCNKFTTADIQHGGCTSMEEIPKKARSKVLETEASCNNMVAAVAAERIGLDSGMAAVKNQWAKDKKFYQKKFDQASKNFQTVASKVGKTVSSGQKEWASVKLIECMLKKFADGSKLDSETQKECKKNLKPNPNLTLVMPKPNQAPDWKTPTFEPLLEDHISKDTSDCAKTMDTASTTKLCTVTSRQAGALLHEGCYSVSMACFVRV